MFYACNRYIIMKFTKMHGCGNDYVYVNCLKEKVENPEKTAIFVSERRFGIGSDGLILIKPSEKADFFMDMYNADGSRGKMCGNGIRCVAKYVYDHEMTDKKSVAIETLSGIKYIDLTVEDGKAVAARVDMGAPILEAEKVPVNVDSPAFKREAGVKALGKEEKIIAQKVCVNGTTAEITCVSMGNPHAIMFVDDVENAPVHSFGSVMECSDLFPEKANIEFVKVIGPKEVRMRVWERGSGETWACGTGACATVVACVLNGKTEDEVLVHMNGGDVVIKYDREKNTVFMTGPAVTVFEGEIENV